MSGLKAKEILLKYYTEDSDLFRLLWRHSNQVAEKAAKIAEKCVVGTATAEFVYEAALLHDIGIFRSANGTPERDCRARKS